MPTLNAEPIDAAILADLIETYEDPRCKVSLSNKTIKLLQHIRAQELQIKAQSREIDRWKAAHTGVRNDYDRLQGEVIRSQRKGRLP